jgi:succinate dehydrogenase / fumarate reductase cytochrome b subunit
MAKAIRLLATSLAKKVVMALSGAMLILFILAHLAGNATMFFGRDSFNSYAAHLHDLGFLLSCFEAALLTIFLIHISFGVLLFFENLRACPSRYTMNRSKGGRTLGSMTMPYTGLIVFFFLLFHLGNFQALDTLDPANTVREVLGRPGYSLLYIGALLCLALHLSHGCWSLLQSLGLNDAKYDCFLRRSAVFAGMIIGLIFLAIPTLFLIMSGFLL